MLLVWRPIVRASIATVATLSFVACKSDQGPNAASDNHTHPAGIIVSNRNVGYRPYAAALTPAGRMLVAQLDNATLLTEIFPDTTFDQGMYVGNVPTDIGLNAAGDIGFVANQYDDEIQVINTNLGQTLSYVAVSGDPFSVVSNASGSTI